MRKLYVCLSGKKTADTGIPSDAPGSDGGEKKERIGGIVVNGFLNVSSSPHVRGDDSTKSIMYDVALALLPAAAFGVYRFGLYSLAVMAVSIVFALLSEYVFQKLAHQKVTVLDGSALVTGLLLGMNLPPTVPLWIPALGSIFAVIFVKQFFGGIGQNFMNPALGARCFLLISFTGIMSDYAVDGVSGRPAGFARSRGSRWIWRSFSWALPAAASVRFPRWQF